MERRELFEAIVKEVKIHRKRMNEARENIKDFKSDIAFVDQYIYRFSKYQDSIGKKLFRSFLELIDEYEHSMSMIDILNKLEKFDIVQKDRWQEIRDLRNEIAHNYEEDVGTAKNFVEAIDMYLPYMDKVVQKIEEYISKRNL